MTITAKYNGKCSGCGETVAAGSKIEWSKTGGARHVACVAGASVPGSIRVQSGERDSRGRRRECRTGGNCSSFGSGRSCGAEDCDGY